MNITRRHVAIGAAVAAVLAIATPVVASFEGLVLHVYPDPATHGAPYTYCYGETANPKFGHKYTVQECQAELTQTLAVTDAGVRACVTVKMPTKTESAFVSTAYNIGVPGFCHSSIAKKANAGDLKGACNLLPQFNHANGKVMKGLTDRRLKERALCLEGVSEGVHT